MAAGPTRPRARKGGSRRAGPRSAGGRRGRPRRVARGDSRQRVLQAAGQLFSDKGYAGTSMGDICSAAKASPSSVYWHFKGGKVDVLLAVIEEVTTSYRDNVLAAVRRGRSVESRTRARLQTVRERSR